MLTRMVRATSEDAPDSSQNVWIPLIQTLASVVSLTFPQLSYVRTYVHVKGIHTCALSRSGDLGRCSTGGSSLPGACLHLGRARAGASTATGLGKLDKGQVLL